MAGYLNPQAPDVSLFTQREQPYQPYQPPQNILPPQTPISNMQRMPLYKELVGSKLGYAQAENNLLKLNQALATPDLNDAQRKFLQDNINLNERAREGYANYANYLRDTAGHLGLDVSDYGEDRTLEESAQSLNNYAAAAVRDLLGAATPRAQAEARYQELRGRGASPAQADRIIAREREGMQENFLSKLSEGIATYGINPDGTINELGLMLAQKMNPGNPQTSVALFGNAFATPKDAFAAGIDMAKVATQAGMTDRRLQQQAAIEQAKIAARQQALYDTFQNNFKLAQYKEGKQDARQQAGFKHAEDMERLKNSLKGMGDTDKLMHEIETLTALTGDPEAARRLVIYDHWSKGIKALHEEDDRFKTQEQFANFTKEQFKKIEYFIETGSLADAKTMLEEFRESVKSPDFKYGGLMGDDGMAFLLATLDDYEQVATGKMTLEDLRKKQNPLPASPGGLAKANHNEDDLRRAQEARDNYRRMQARRAGQHVPPADQRQGSPNPYYGSSLDQQPQPQPPPYGATWRR